MIDLIKALKACKNYFNKQTYRKNLARIYAIHLSQHIENKSQIHSDVNFLLREENLKEVSYTFILNSIDNNVSPK